MIPARGRVCKSGGGIVEEFVKDSKVESEVRSRKSEVGGRTGGVLVLSSEYSVRRLLRTTLTSNLDL